MSASNLQQFSTRNAFIGLLRDFVRDAGFEMQLDLAVDLVYGLADYREEDTLYFPNVYMLRSLETAGNTGSISPAAERIRLGEIPIEEGAGARLLKNCAALAENGWSVYIDVDGKTARYGLFRSEKLPTSLSPSDMLADSTEAESGLLIRNCSRSCVELLAGGKKRFELHLSPCKPPTDSSTVQIDKLARAFSQSASESREELEKYFSRLFFNLTLRSHGTIICVVPADVGLPEYFTDGVVLDGPIDFAMPHKELREQQSAETLSQLTGIETLLQGMIKSDGITVLNSDCKILAFRVFVRPESSELESLSGLEITGGARSRAFNLLKQRIGHGINCVFFRSQDGKCECEVCE